MATIVVRIDDYPPGTDYLKYEGSMVTYNLHELSEKALIHISEHLVKASTLISQELTKRGYIDHTKETKPDSRGSPAPG